MPSWTEIGFHLSLIAGQFSSTQEDCLVPTVDVFEKSLRLGERLISVQIRKLLNIHLEKHGQKRPSILAFERKLQNSCLSSAPNSHHSRRLLNSIKADLVDGQHRADKRKERLLRSEFKQEVKSWSVPVKELISLFLSEFFEEKFQEAYEKVKRLTGCDGLRLHLPKDSCVSVFILQGCSAFPRVSTTWLTIHSWCMSAEECDSVSKARDFVNERVIEPAKEKLKNEQPPKPFVNLSSQQVSAEAEEILNKGLSFVPSVSSRESFDIDVERFLNNLLWKDYWLNRVPTKKISPEVEERLKSWPVKKEKSGAKAPLPKPGSAYLALASSAEKILKYNHLKRWPRPTPNVSAAGLREIKNLARSPDTIFVEADKGAGLILLDRSKYLEKMYGDILQDLETYEEVNEDQLEDVESRFLSLLKEQKDLGEMFEEEASPLVEVDPKTPRMFGLPKLHKAGNPMRPVVSCVGSVLSKSGSLLDNVVKPAVSKGWQFLKDSTSTLEYLESRYANLREKGFSKDQIFVVSYDVAAFYPSVPHDLAIQAFERARNDLKITEEQFSSLKKILKFHLENSYFKFNGKCFRQKTGLPIGSAIGGPIACLALALEEDRLLEELRESDPELAEIFEWYRRYLDDSVLMFGAENQGEANRLANRLFVLLKGMNPAFDFTTTNAVKQLVVLDISIDCSSEGLKLKNYQKPTDKRTLLSASSCHPSHVKRAIPYSVALRMRRLCSDDEDFRLALVEQAWALLGRGHSEAEVAVGFTRAVLKPREEALKRSKKKDTKNMVRLVTTFDPHIEVTKAFKRIRKEKEALEETTAGTHLKDIGLQLAFRNPLNLRRMLVNKEPKKEVTDPECFEGFSRCSARCVFCRDVVDGQKVKKIPEVFTSKMQPGDARKKILQDLKVPTSSCSTKNLVYLCGCLTCGLFYVGETGDTLNKRCSRHRPQPSDRDKFLKDGPDKNWSEVRRHFASENHSNAFWVAPLFVCKEEAPDSFRKKKEAFWIRRLRPQLNVKLQPRDDTRTRTPSISSLSSTGSPPVSPVIRRKLGLATVPRK